MHRLLSHHEEGLQGLTVEGGHGSSSALSRPVSGSYTENWVVQPQPLSISNQPSCAPTGCLHKGSRALQGTVIYGSVLKTVAMAVAIHIMYIYILCSETRLDKAACIHAYTLQIYIYIYTVFRGQMVLRLPLCKHSVGAGLG